MGLQIGLDAALRFDAKKAVADAAIIGGLVADIDDRGIRLAAQEIAQTLPHNLTLDDSDDLIAAELGRLHTACVRWER